MAADLPKEVKAEFERRAWEMRISGEKNLAAIAAELINPATGKPISTSTVSRMLSRVEQRLAKEFANKAEHVKARQTAQLERLFDEALDAWRRSKEPAETVTVTQGRAATTREGEVVPLPDQVVRQAREQTGDPRFIEQARGALADIRAIWGLDAPKKQDITSAGQAVKAYVGFDPEEV